MDIMVSWFRVFWGVGVGFFWSGRRRREKWRRGGEGCQHSQMF